MIMSAHTLSGTGAYQQIQHILGRVRRGLVAGRGRRPGRIGEEVEIGKVSTARLLRLTLKTDTIQGDEIMKFHHLGIPTSLPQAGETYLEEYKTYCTDHRRNPFGIQWMRFEHGCPLPDIVKTLPHVAFEVDDLEQALAGHEILIEPNSPSEGVLVAFVLCDGAPVEFLQFLQK